MLRSLLCAAAFLALGLSAPNWAEVVFKSTMPDGRIIYSEKPMPGAKKVQEIVPQTGNTGVRTISPQDKQQLQELEGKRKRDVDRQTQIQEAEKALQEAEAAMQAGKEPLPGERLGIAGGGTRLSEAYFERQKALQTSVEAARKRLEEARAGG